MPGDRMKSRERKLKRIQEQWSGQQKWIYKKCELCGFKFVVNNFADRQPRTPRIRGRITCAFCRSRGIQQAVDFAWAAGFIEGDGCFGTKTGKSGKLYLQLQVGQKTPERLELLQSIFGDVGRITGPYERTLQSGNPSTMCYYRLLNQEAVQRVLRSLWPFFTPQMKQKIKPLHQKVKRVNKEREAR